jgi:hypothetical protein
LPVNEHNQIIATGYEGAKAVKTLLRVDAASSSSRGGPLDISGSMRVSASEFNAVLGVLGELGGRVFSALV